MSGGNPRKRLERIYRAAVAAADPASCVRGHLEPARDGAIVHRGGREIVVLARERTRIVAVGKAATAMASAAARVLGGGVPGLVVAPPGGRHVRPPLVRAIGEHPAPGAGSHAAGRAVWTLLADLAPEDAVLVLLSGGASSVLALPTPDVSLRDKIATTRLLLAAGATIAETNTVRKHLSRLKGGGLARRAAPARVVTLVLSDVIGDRPAVIGSGPTVADPTTFADAWRVLARHDLLERIPARVLRRLDRGRRGEIADTAKPGEIRTRTLVVGNVATALAGAADEARRVGFEVVIAKRRLSGEAKHAAARVARDAARERRRPACLLYGGETTVRVSGDGRGGRNQELALALAPWIEGRRDVFALAAGTDGIDGPTDAAGAFVDGGTVARASRLALDPRLFLQRNDSHGFFSRTGDLFRPGPTGTNVMDLTIVLIGAAEGGA